jgi:hypothetical protein
MSLSFVSDVLALVWCTISVCCARSSRRSTIWALACGAAIGVAILVRPSNCLIALPVLVLLGKDWKRIGAVILGGLPFAVLLAVYQSKLYGSIFETGYGAGVVTDFSRSFVVPSTENFVLWLGRSFGWIIPGLTIPGLLLGRAEPRVRLALATWLLAFVIFYAPYKYSSEAWWYLRFLLPIYPPLLTGAALCGDRILGSISKINHRVGKAAKLISGLLLSLIFASSITLSIQWTRKLNATSIADGERVYPDTADWMRDHVEPHAVVLCMQVSGALLYLSNYPILRYDYLDEAGWAYVRQWQRAQHVPLYAVLFPFEYAERNVLESRIPGDWLQVGNVRHVRIYRLLN